MSRSRDAPILSPGPTDQGGGDTLSADIPTYEPDRVTAGDSISWRISLEDYKSPTWTLIYYLVQSGSQITATASSQSDGSHLIAISPATSGSWTAGRYDYQGRVVQGTASAVTVRTGVLEVRPNFATSTAGLDGRAHARIVLDALEARLENRATQDQLSYSIAGRSIQYMTPTEVLTWRDVYRAEVRKLEDEERLAKGLPARTSIRVRFGGNV